MKTTSFENNWPVGLLQKPMPSVINKQHSNKEIMYSNTHLIQSKSTFFLQQSAHRVLTYFHELKGQPVYESMLQCHAFMTQAICEFNEHSPLEQHILAYDFLVHQVIEFKTLLRCIIQEGLDFPGMDHVLHETHELYYRLQNEVGQMRIYLFQIQNLNRPN